MKLVILYSTMSHKIQRVKTRKEAEMIVHSEGDHVWDWYVEEENKNKPKKVLDKSTKVGYNSRVR